MFSVSRVSHLSVPYAQGCSRKVTMAGRTFLTTPNAGTKMAPLFSKIDESTSVGRQMPPRQWQGATVRTSASGNTGGGQKEKPRHDNSRAFLAGVCCVGAIALKIRGHGDPTEKEAQSFKKDEHSKSQEKEISRLGGVPFDRGTLREISQILPS